MSVQYPYRAVICGEEHIVKGWRGLKLLTDKGGFTVRHLYGNWQFQDYRLFEVALIQSDGKDGWLVNGKQLSLLESLPMGGRLANIPDDEDLRVHKNKIRAVAWVETNGRSAKVTELLDGVKKFWEKASLPTAEPDKDPSVSKLLAELSRGLLEISRLSKLLATWSKPIWLTEFRATGEKIPISPEQKKLARTATELQETKAQLRKVKAVASDNLEAALSKWFRFDPPGMSANTKARIEKAVKLYVTDPQKRSLSKIAAEFKVSRKTVSGWFKTFTKETGYPVVTFERHESVREHLQADSEQKEVE